MATSTTNLGLIKPGGSDKIRIAQINQNMDTLDAKIGAVGQTSLQAQVTALNTRTTTYNIGSVASLSSLKSSLLTYAQSLTARDVRAVSLYASSAIGSGFVSGQTYQGTLHIASKTNDVLTFSITFESSNDQPPIWVNYKNGTWTVEQLAINSDVAALNSNLTNKIKKKTITFSCVAGTWQYISLSTLAQYGISETQIINIVPSFGQGRWIIWRIASGNVIFLRFNTSDTNIVIDNTEGDFSLDIIHTDNIASSN